MDFQDCVENTEQQSQISISRKASHLRDLMDVVVNMKDLLPSQNMRMMASNDTMGERFTAEINIEAKWIDDSVVAKYDSNIHWNPLLYVENIMSIQHHKIHYTTTVLDDNRTIVVQSQNIRGVFWERLELYNFPIDVQELSVTLRTTRKSNEVNLISNKFKLSTIDKNVTKTFVDQQKWHLYRLVKVKLNSNSESNGNQNNYDDDTMTTGGDEDDDEDDKSPKYIAKCYCSRKPSYYFLNAYFLIFLLTGSSLTIFSMDRTLPQSRLQTGFTILLTSVSFKWVINRSLPAISYSTSLDKYSIISIFLLCCMCVWHSIVGSFWLDDQSLAFGKLIDRWAILAFFLFFLLINLVFVLWLLKAYGIIRRIKKDETEFLKAKTRQKSIYQITSPPQSKHQSLH